MMMNELDAVRDNLADPRPAKPAKSVLLHGGIGPSSAVIPHLAHLPEGSTARIKAIALARRYAAIPDHASGKEKRAVDTNGFRDHARLDFARGVLMGLGVLHEGMRLEDAVAVLGEPTEIREGGAKWYYSSGMHVNPGLVYQFADAKSGGNRGFRVMRR